MSLIQDKFASVFSNYDVTTQARPDGGILLTLRNTEGKQIKRSISYQQLHTADQLTWVISAIRRDLAEQASELPQISMLQSQHRFPCRPTIRHKYHGVSQGREAVALHGPFLSAQPAPDRFTHRLDPVIDVQLAVDIAQVKLHRGL